MNYAVLSVLDIPRLKLGYKQYEIDKAAFRWHKNSRLEVVLIIRADDLFVTGSN